MDVPTRPGHFVLIPLKDHLDCPNCLLKYTLANILVYIVNKYFTSSIQIY